MCVCVCVCVCIYIYIYMYICIYIYIYIYTSEGCGMSAACSQSIVRPSSRGGVPVLSRESGRPSRSSVAATPTLAPSTSSAASSSFSDAARARANRPVM